MSGSDILDIGEILILNVSSRGKQKDAMAFYYGLVIIISQSKHLRLGEKVKVKIVSINNKTAFATLIK